MDGYILDVDTEDDYSLLSTLKEALETREAHNGRAAPNRMLNGKHKPSKNESETGSEQQYSKLLAFDSCFADRQFKAPAALCICSNRNLNVYDATSNTILIYDALRSELVQRVRTCDCQSSESRANRGSPSRRTRPGYHLLPNYMTDDVLASLPCCGSLYVLDRQAQLKLRMRVGGINGSADVLAACVDLRGSCAYALANADANASTSTCELETFDLRFGNSVFTSRLNIPESVARCTTGSADKLDLHISAMCVNAVRQHELLVLATAQGAARADESFLFAVDLRRGDSVRSCIALSDANHRIRRASDCTFNLCPRGIARNLCDLLVLHSCDEDQSVFVSVLDAVTFDLRERMLTDRPTLFGGGIGARLATSVNETESNMAHVCASDTPFITTWLY